MLFGQLANVVHLTRMTGVGVACDVAHHDEHAPAQHDDAAGCCFMCAFASSERLLVAAFVASALTPFERARSQGAAAFGARDVAQLRPPTGWASSWSAQAPPAIS